MILRKIKIQRIFIYLTPFLSRENASVFLAKKIEDFLWSKEKGQARTLFLVPCTYCKKHKKLFIPD